MTYTLSRPLLKLANITAGHADVHRLTNDPAMPGYVLRERLGAVYRHESGDWVPITRAWESHAAWPQYPRFSSRQEAARALFDGEVVY